MRPSTGWGQVIRFDAFKSPDRLSPRQRAEKAVCSFVNEFVDLFNEEPLSVRLACVCNLLCMVFWMAVAAFVRCARRLPYFEPTQLSDESGKSVYVDRTD